MSAKHAVLGLVIEQRGYGYQLAQRLEQRCGAWGWESSGVYEALGRLERDEHVRRGGQKGSGADDRGARRVIYAPTPAGVEFFEAWVSKSSAPTPFRQELDLKILLSGPELLPSLIDQTWGHEQVCIDELRTLMSARRAPAAEHMSLWRSVALMLQHDAQVMMLETRIEWLQYARKTMRMVLDRTPGNQRR